MKKLIYILFASLLGVSCVKYDLPEDGPVLREGGVRTLLANDIFSGYATLQGRYDGKLADIREQGFEIIDSAQVFNRTMHTEDVTEGLFTYKIDGLEAGTSYKVRAFVVDRKGNTVYADPTWFKTTPWDIHLPDPAVTSDVVALGARSIKVSLTMPDRVGTEHLADSLKTITSVKFASVGIYYWTEGGDTTVYEAFTEAEAKRMSLGESASFELRGLSEKTEYKFKAYVRTAAYYFEDEARNQPAKWVAYANPVLESAEREVTTRELQMPKVTTVNAESATNAAILYGQVNDMGQDYEVTAGFYYGVEPGNLKYEVPAADIGKSLEFECVVRSLSPLTRYYYQAYARNASKEGRGEVVEMNTTDVSRPLIRYKSFGYEYTVENITAFKATLKAEMISDGGQAISSCGVAWGISPENLDHTATGSYDPGAGMVSVAVEGLQPSRVYYYKIFATNESGTDEGAVYSFRTGAYGGRQYNYNPSMKGLIWQRMQQTGPELFYHELPPISAGGKKYYVLDRNLGATQVATKDNYNRMCSNKSEPIYDLVGYYYQWGNAIPSGTPDIRTTTYISAGYADDRGWTNDPQYDASGNLWWIVPGDTWTDSPCPEGYVIPSRNDWNAIMGTMETNLFSEFFDMMRLSTTNYRTAKQGAIFAGSSGSEPSNNYQWECALWCSDAPNATGTNGRRLRVFANYTHSISTLAPSVVNTNRYIGIAVRCIRVE